jgi:hypothetical protein
MKVVVVVVVGGGCSWGSAFSAVAGLAGMGDLIASLTGRRPTQQRGVP